MGKNFESEPPPELVGQFVVVCSEKLHGPYKTYAAAIQAARRISPDKPYYIMRVVAAEPPKDPQ